MNWSSKLAGVIVFAGATSLIGCRGAVKDATIPHGEIAAADAAVAVSGSIPLATIDSGSPAGGQDAGTKDGGVDAGGADAGKMDSGTADAGPAGLKKDAGMAPRRAARKSDGGTALRKDAGVISTIDGGTK